VSAPLENISILAELTALLTSLGIPVETGVFSSTPPNTYCVLTPIHEEFALYADNMPVLDVAEVRISLFTRENYTKLKNRIVKVLILADFTITERRYVGRDDETGYFCLAVDVEKSYFVDMEGVE